jgi:DUF971 family protein
MTFPSPIEVKLLQKKRILEIEFDNGEKFFLPCEYLRVFSSSADVKGHGQSEGKLVTGKKDINISDIEPVGHYAIKLLFDDGHNTGIYSWETLYDLAVHHKIYWQRYLDRLEAAKASREITS